MLWKVSECTMDHRLLHLRLLGCKPVRLSVLNPVFTERAYDGHVSILTARGGTWSDNSHFHLHLLIKFVWVHMHHTWGRDGSRMNYGRRQASRGRVMLWEMFCWEYWVLAFINIIADQTHPFMATVFPTLQKCSGMGSRCWPGPHISQILNWLSIRKMSRTDKSNPWLHFATFRGPAATVLVLDTTAHLQRSYRALLVAKGNLHKIMQIVLLLLLNGVYNMSF